MDRITISNVESVFSSDNPTAKQRPPPSFMTPYSIFVVVVKILASRSTAVLIHSALISVISSSSRQLFREKKTRKKWQTELATRCQKTAKHLAAKTLTFLSGVGGVQNRYKMSSRLTFIKLKKLLVLMQQLVALHSKPTHGHWKWSSYCSKKLHCFDKTMKN